jgi:hypothetical protein
MTPQLTPQQLALYLGCEVQTCHRHYPDPEKKSEWKIGTIMDIDLVLGQVGVWFPEEQKENLVNFYPKDVKPILRRLSSMTVGEATEITKALYGKIFGLPDEIKELDEVLTDSPDSVGWICIGLEKERVGITIDIDRGIELSLGGNKMKVNQFDCIVWLLPKFDLFNWIDAGLAIEKKP